MPLPGAQHLSTLSCTPYPVGESIERIVRTGDDLRSQQGAAVAEDLADDILTSDLEWSVRRLVDFGYIVPGGGRTRVRFAPGPHAGSPYTLTALIYA